jgi:DNA recombination protein RmuC
MSEVILIIGGALLAALVILAGLWVLGRGAIDRLLLSLIQKNEEHRGQTESGVKNMLDGNRELMDRMVGELRQQLRDSQREIGDLKNQNAAIKQGLESAAKATEGLQASTESLRSLLSNNRLRGDWGEQVAEDLLLAAGFVEGVNYTKQTSTAEGRPDFTFLLPDGTKLNIDAKFPFDDLIAYQEAKSEGQKQAHLKAFESAVKTKVKDITSKDYIDPGNQTCDFVVMFIPNEMIFSFIYEKLPKLNDYCAERKVVLAGPFGFTALVRLVLQAYKNFRYEQGLQEILGLIGKFQVEYQKFGDHMDKLGRSLDTAQKTFLEVEGTRSRSLGRVVDKIAEHSHSQLSDQVEKRIEVLALDRPEE